MKPFQSVLSLIDGSLCESIFWVMEDSPLVISIVPYKDGAFTNYLKAGPFMSDFIFPFVPVPCLWGY